METRILKTLSQWFPEAFADVKKSELVSDYRTLLHFAKYTLKLINENSESKKEPFKIILLLYSKGSLYEKNAIENEFLKVLSDEENAMKLKEHLDLMPENLKPVYLKTIVEN
jgi:hypothetical protein